MKASILPTDLTSFAEIAFAIALSLMSYFIFLCQNYRNFSYKMSDTVLRYCYEAGFKVKFYKKDSNLGQAHF
ncbi:hypothetical protein F895_02158 [Acinetobacter sp. CIP 64.2]|nr:hypothetical protein F895_02158 [Acinetobacter sp. CIP 64.2]